MQCKNCNHAINTGQNFCGNCGAKVIRNRLNPRILAEQVNQEILAIDNRLFRTFYALFRAPEDVIVGYIKGVRKKYQDVLQYFAIALTLAGFQVFIMSVFFSDAFVEQDQLLKSLENTPGQENNPFRGINSEDYSNYQGLVYILTVPFSALSSCLAYYLVGDRRYNLTEHFVINLYYSAQIIIVNAILSTLFLILDINYLLTSSLAIITTVLYFFYVLKRVFYDQFLVTLAKYIIVAVFYSIFFILIITVLTLVLFLLK